MQVGKRSLLAREPNVASTLHSASGTSGDDDGQIALAVNGRHAERGSIEQQGMIEQRSIRLLNGVELVQVIGQQLRMVLVDLRQRIELVLLEIVMRDLVKSHR